MNKKAEEEFRVMAETMDRQEAYFASLREFVRLHGKDRLPTEHKVGYLKAMINGPKPWRERPVIVRRIRKAAKKAAR